MYLMYVHSFNHSTSLPANVTPVTGPSSQALGSCSVHPLNVHSTRNQNRYLKSCEGDSDEHFQLLFFWLLFSLSTTLPGTVGKARHNVLDFLSSYSQACLLLKHLPGLPFPTGNAPHPPSTLYAPCSLSRCVRPLLQEGPSSPGWALCFLCWQQPDPKISLLMPATMALLPGQHLPVSMCT